jgi:hypothetical protein
LVDSIEDDQLRGEIEKALLRLFESLGRDALKNHIYKNNK